MQSEFLEMLKGRMSVGLRVIYEGNSSLSVYVGYIELKVGWLLLSLY